MQIYSRTMSEGGFTVNERGSDTSPKPLSFADIITQEDQDLCTHARMDLKVARKWHNKFFFGWMDRFVSWLDEA